MFLKNKRKDIYLGLCVQDHNRPYTDFVITAAADNFFIKEYIYYNFPSYHNDLLPPQVSIHEILFTEVLSLHVPSHPIHPTFSRFTSSSFPFHLPIQFTWYYFLY